MDGPSMRIRSWMKASSHRKPEKRMVSTGASSWYEKGQQFDLTVESNPKQTFHRFHVYIFVACLFFVLIFLCLGLCCPATLKGGPIGNYIDKRLLRYNIRQAMQARRQQLLESGVTLPTLDTRNNRFKKETPSPFGALAESLSRALRNKQEVWIAERFAEQWKSLCKSRQSALDRNHLNIPNRILQPNQGEWYHPLTGIPDSATIMQFDDSEMRRLLREQFPDLLEPYESETTTSNKVSLWTICALYWYGGYAFGSSVRDVSRLTKEIDGLDGRPYGDYAVMLASGQPSPMENEKPRWIMMASSPRHPRLLCLIREMINAGKLVDPLVHYMPDPPSSTQTTQSPDNSPQIHGWKRIDNSCTEGVESCCREVSPTNGINALVEPNQPQFFVKEFSALRSVQVPKLLPTTFSPRVEVTISELPGEEQGIKHNKLSLRQRLEDEGCQPSWLCHRCLRTKLFGSFESCSFACNACYENFQCMVREEPRRLHNIRVKVHQKRTRNPGETLIPRIIHQTYPELLSTKLYPELARLQNSWRYSGFEFRYYNDTAARDYIAFNYPKHFLDAYEAFKPGAFQADFFRLLVLLKDGGIYCDADVQVETNLHSFLTPDLSFFVPRETIRDLAGQDFCLWNGLMGASPGHPIIARAVERMIQTIDKREDYFDVEQNICRAMGRSASIWKLRSLPTLLLSGPCALGMSVNDALGKADLLSPFEPGWLPQLRAGNLEWDDQIGDSLIILADKQDMGYFRFSDIDRNLIVASTDMAGLSKRSISSPPAHFRPHYSETEYSSDIYGSDGVYTEATVTSEITKLELVYLKS